MPPLSPDLALRSLADRPDAAEPLAAFHAQIHGPGMVPFVTALIRDHPDFRPEHWLFIEEQATRRIVAGLCLLPWTLSYHGVALRSAEMGIVGTLEEYRGRGLFQALDARFKELTRQGGYDLSQIQGIPYFYRQFGYEYAIPLEPWCRVELHQFAGDPPPGHTLRLAGLDDLATLMALADAAAAQLAVSSVRGERVWRYLLGPSLPTETGGEPWLIAGEDGAVAGYIRVMRAGFGDGLICGEAAQMGEGAARAALHWLVAEARRRGKPYVRLNLPPGHILNQIARAHGAHFKDDYAWQIRLPDPPALLRRLAPVLERRLAASPFAGLTRTLRIDQYRHTLALSFAGGRLAEVRQLAVSDGGDLRLPPQLLAPLLFGWRTLDELRHIYPDAYAVGGAQPLVDALFPRAEAFLYSVY